LQAIVRKEENHPSIVLKYPLTKSLSPTRSNLSIATSAGDQIVLSKTRLSQLLLPGISVMDRYIITQLLMPFLFGVGAFSSIILAVGSLFELVRQIAESGLPIDVALKVIALQMPQFVVYSFPMSTLLAAMMTYSRLSADSETIALQSCGISIYRILAPAIILSFVVTGMTFACNEFLAPAGSQEAAITLNRALKQDKPMFKKDNITYFQYRDEDKKNGKKEQVLDRLFYAQKFDGKQMTGLTILDRSRKDSGLSQILNAESATWDSNNNVWNFENGTIYLIAPDASYRNIVQFKQQKLQLPKSPFEIAAPDKNPDNMNIAESIDYLEDPQVKGDRKQSLKIAVSIQRKLSLPFACVVFSLLGAVMGIRPQRTSKATSFGVSVLLIFGYYVIMFVAAALGESGVISPFLAGWFPLILGLASGSWLVFKIAK
jgi:lipopolysaccharide export system permease protein